ncbi:unnamed protein product [Urochloa humidicola]
MNPHHLTITNVYAPADHRDSRLFLNGLLELAPHVHGPWLLVGDFNLVRDTGDKNNGHINHALCSAFNDTVDALGVIELPLLERLFTWSNMREQPTLARFDRAFFSNAFSCTFPDTSLTSLPRPTSDHYPLLVRISTTIPRSSLFCFENTWLHNPTFLESLLPT